MELSKNCRVAGAHGYWDGLFPSNDHPLLIQPGYRNYINPIELFSYYVGLTLGYQELLNKVISGEWIKIGGIYGPIPEGSNAGYWEGKEEIVWT